MLKWWPSCIYLIHKLKNTNKISTSHQAWLLNQSEFKSLWWLPESCIVTSSNSFVLKCRGYGCLIMLQTQHAPDAPHESKPARLWDECAGVPTLVKLWTERSITHPFLSYRVTVGHLPSAGYSVANEKCINMKEFKLRPRKESIREIQQAHFWDLLLLLSCVSLFSLLFDLLPLCKYFISEVLHFDL